jgi:hypothetical protein
MRTDAKTLRIYISQLLNGISFLLTLLPEPAHP